MDFFSIQVKAWRVAVLFLVLSSLLISGWLIFVKVSEPAYYDLRRNMSMAEVRAIMGKPDLVCPGRHNETEWLYDVQHWSGNHTAELWFRSGRLVGGNAGKGRPIAQ